MKHNSEPANNNHSVSKKYTIKSKLGLHARPAALFVETANKFMSDIYVRKGDRRINAKSIMGLMMLAAGYGSKITIECEGQDAHDALKSIEALIVNNFNE